MTRALGIALGVAADAVLGDPKKHHPVAWFGTFASKVEPPLTLMIAPMERSTSRRR
ncbi:MAG: hypothetical protein R2722_01240 [Tessaracoccus sp.]